MKYLLGKMRHHPNGVLLPIYWFNDDDDLSEYPPPIPVLNDQAMIAAASPEQVTDAQVEEAVYERGWHLTHSEPVEPEKVSPAVRLAMEEPQPLGTTGTLPAKVRERRRQRDENERREIEAEQRRVADRENVERAQATSSEDETDTGEADDPSDRGSEDETGSDPVGGRVSKRGR